MNRKIRSIYIYIAARLSPVRVSRFPNKIVESNTLDANRAMLVKQVSHDFEKKLIQLAHLQHKTE